MRFSVLAVAAAAATSVSGWKIPCPPKKGLCLTSSEASDLVNAYAQVIGNYSQAVADKYLSVNFTDYSDSINTLVHQPLGGPTFPSKAIFEEAQSQNPKVPIDVTAVNAVTCDVIALTWTANFGASPLPVAGISVIKTVYEDGAWKFLNFKVEFNSLIWLLNSGGNYTWEGVTYSPGNTDPTLTPLP